MKNFINLIIALVAIASFTVACGGSSNDAKGTKNASTTAAKPAIDGSKIYKLNCTVCHGVGGDMGASGAHDLTKSALSLEERVAVITNGRNTMTPFASILSAEKIKAVAEYTMTLK